uniref:CRISPR system precrRNA processing endoribonuclease RAMP protein Cas6 n=1 Tax=Candidatus Electrothrix sp. TaxID=2170559 RepID=UPI0040565A2A
MKDCTPNLIIAEYRFTFTARDHLTLPLFSDPLRRSVFGLALHQQSCITPDADCADCMLGHQCDFAFFIKGLRPPEARMMRKVGTVPLPHIFHSDQCGAASIAPGGLFTHGLVLAGAACKRLSAVIRAMEKSGQLGFGSDRAKAELIQVSQVLPGSQRLLRDRQGEVQEGVMEPMPVPSAPAALRLQFVTPYLPSDTSFRPETLEISRLLMAVIRRVSLLQYFYMGFPLEADFRAIKECAAQSEVIGIALRLHKTTCWSARQGRAVEFRGFLGTVDFTPAEPELFWPFLYLGQWLHIGKQASKGFGRYQLLER